MKKIASALLFLALLWACSSDSGVEPIPPPTGETPDPEPPTEVNFDRSAMLVNWADNIIVPSYEGFETKLSDLETAFQGFKTDATNVNYTLLRDAWTAAYKEWQRVSLFEIGPAENIGYRLQMNIYPTDTEKIDAFVATGTYDLSLPSNRSAKGFPALDYLLNGLDTTEEAIVLKYNSGDNREALLTYFEVVLNDMTTLTTTVVSGWKEGYRDTFVANSGSSATASADRMLNDYVFYYEKFLRAGKLGIPLGVFSGVQAPGAVEARYREGLSNELFQEGLHAVQDFFNGKPYGSNASGESMASYLISLDRQDLSDDINAQFDSARSAINGLQTFSAELQSNPAVSMLSAYDEVQKAVSLLKVDMFSAMSISVDYVDADGD